MTGYALRWRTFAGLGAAAGLGVLLVRHPGVTVVAYAGAVGLLTFLAAVWRTTVAEDGEDVRVPRARSVAGVVAMGFGAWGLASVALVPTLLVVAIAVATSPRVVERGWLSGCRGPGVRGSTSPAPRSSR